MMNFVLQFLFFAVRGGLHTTISTGRASYNLRVVATDAGYSYRVTDGNANWTNAGTSRAVGFILQEKTIELPYIYAQLVHFSYLLILILMERLDIDMLPDKML